MFTIANDVYIVEPLVRAKKETFRYVSFYLFQISQPPLFSVFHLRRGHHGRRPRRSHRDGDVVRSLQPLYSRLHRCLKSDGAKIKQALKDSLGLPSYVSSGLKLVLRLSKSQDVPSISDMR